jgi:hypothetical protein
MQEDEDLRSIVYKYHLLSSNQTIEETNQELFGIRSRYLSLFPRNIGNIFADNKVHINGDAGRVIYNHTYFNIARLFHGHSENLTMLRYLYDGEGTKSFQSRSFISKIIMYCPMCVTEDLDTVGECYIHRIHQFANAVVCIKHKSRLISVCPACNNPLCHPDGYYQLRKTSCSVCHHELENQPVIELNQEIEKQMIKFLETTQYLFSLGPASELSSDMVEDRYWAYAFEKGYINETRLNNKKIETDLLVRYPREVLKNFNIMLNEEVERFVAKFISFKDGYSNLLQHYVFIDLFAGSIEGFIEDKLPEISLEVPFGVGPWPCKNDLCSKHEDNEKIVHCIKKYNRKIKAVVGKFNCPECGMVYHLAYSLEQRTVTDSSFKIVSRGELWANHISNITKSKTKLELKNLGINRKIKERMKKALSEKNLVFKNKGTIYRNKEWFEQLILLHKQNMPITIMRKELKSCSTTIKKYIKLFKDQGETMDAFSTLRYSNEHRLDRLEQIKNKVLKLLDQNPELNRSRIREFLGEADYIFIRQNDKGWIEKIIPLNEQRENIDWNEIDNCICDFIEKIAEEIYKSNPKHQVKIVTILNILPSKYRKKIERNPENFPSAVLKLEEKVEGDEQFQIRKIPSVINRLKKKGFRITVENVLKQKIFQSCSNRVINEIRLNISIGFLKVENGVEKNWN